VVFSDGRLSGQFAFGGSNAQRKWLESEVVVPYIALQMEHDAGKQPFEEFKEEQVQELIEAETATLEIKRGFITGYFKEIEKGDCVLAYNPTKHGLEGYVGANVLMELTIGFYLSKKLFIWNQPSKKLGCFDELEAIGVQVLDGQAKRLMQ
jgi:hypothetical protein